MRIEVTADFRKSITAMDVLAGRAGNLTPVFAGPIDRSVTSFFKQQFETQGIAGGHQWPPLKPSTILARTRASHGGRARSGKRGRARAGFAAILIDTRRAWASFVKSGGPESIRIIGAQSLVRGSSVPYMPPHHVTQPDRPKRPVVPDPIPTWLNILWERSITRYVVTGKLSGIAKLTGGGR